MNYIPVIGLEVHLQSKTKSKMFCSCPADYFGKDPNTQICPTCLGLPGALPTINKSAIDYCIKLAIALNCKINRKTKFDRKNYFYPDLPKGYQISQYGLPIGYDGYLEVDVNGDSYRIRIERVHQEEDTGKSIHEKDSTFLDFNKSGVPLIEIVSAPDFTDVKEVIEYAKELKRIARYLDISDTDMEKGQMRFELNISMKEFGKQELPDYKIEIKNIGSISVLEKVINYEIKRQTKLLEKGKKINQETRGLRGMSGKTVSQRVKEGSADYRYFPEPDLPPIKIDDSWIQDISLQIPELPKIKRERFSEKYNLEPDVARVITDSSDMADWFEKTLRGVSDLRDEDSKKYKEVSKNVANWFIGDFMKLLNKSKLEITDLKFRPNYLLELVNLHLDSKISGSVAKQVLEESFQTGQAPGVIVNKKGLEQITDGSKIKKVVEKVIKGNDKVVKDYKDGKENAIQYLVGQVMRETRGQADPQLAEKILKDFL